MNRNIVKLGLIYIVSIVFLLVAFESSVCAKTVKLKLAHFMPTMHIQHKAGFVPFVEEVKRLTNGRVEIKIYPGGSLGNPKTMVNSIKKGVTDIGFVLPSYVPGRFKRSSVFEMPFIFKNSVHVTKVMYDLYDDHFAKDYKDFKVLWFLSSPLSQVHTVKKPIRGVDDFNGLTIRTSGVVETSSLKLLGANPVGMPISEMSISLQKGVVDGAVTPFAAMNSFKLFGTINYVTEVNISGTLMAVLMNKKKWQSLPDFAKKAIDQAAGRQMGIKAAAAYLGEDEENIEKAKASNIKIYKPSGSEMQAIQSRIGSIWTDWVKKTSGKGIQAQELLDAVLASAKRN